MDSKKVGRIKNIKYSLDGEDLEVTILITDSKFKKKLIRNLSLMGKIEFDGENIIYNANTSE